MVASRLVTAGELADIEHGGSFELIEGELVPVSPTFWEPSVVTMYLGAALVSFVEPRELGLVLSPEGGWLILRDPDTLVAPDIGYVRAARIPDPLPDGFLPFAPDLAVEVVSRSNSDQEIRRKTALYGQAGVPLVWVVYPGYRAVTIYELGVPPVTLRSGDVLTGGDVIPGFAREIDRIFAFPLGKRARGS